MLSTPQEKFRFSRNSYAPVALEALDGRPVNRAAAWDSGASVKGDAAKQSGMPTLHVFAREVESARKDST